MLGHVCSSHMFQYHSSCNPFFCCSGSGGETGGGRQWGWRRWRWEFLGQGAAMWDVTKDMGRIRRSEGYDIWYEPFCGNTSECAGIWYDIANSTAWACPIMASIIIYPNTWPFRWGRSWHSNGGDRALHFQTTPVFGYGSLVLTQQLKVMDVIGCSYPHRVWSQDEQREKGRCLGFNWEASGSGQEIFVRRCGSKWGCLER